MTQRDLDTMDRHIAEAEEEIRGQRKLVEDMRTGGGNTIAEEAEQLLSKVIDALEEMKEHRRVIIENLLRKGWGEAKQGAKMLQSSMYKTDIRRTVRRLGIAFAALVFAELSSAQAQESATEGWNQEPSTTSGGFAQARCQLLGTAGLSWPDGRQGIITFWHCEDGKTARCLDYFDAEMAATGGRCDSVTMRK
jgi:hypothetical protein